MDRRLFLGSLGASVLFAASPGQAFEGAQAEISIFEGLITNITRLLQAASSPGDFHNRINVLRFLRKIYSPLNSMQVAKIQIQKDLDRLSTPCAAVPQTTRDALTQLEKDRRELGALLHRLAQAIRPMNMEKSMAQLGERMASLYAEKGWVFEAWQFCGITDAERRKLRSDVRASRLALGRVYESLNALVARLNSPAA